MAVQSLFFRGIYEFEDPSAALLAAKIPAVGTVDLFAGTVVVIKPNQQALFIYQGRLADTINSGTYQINTHNVPILTRLASWKFGFESPLRAELIFFARQLFTARRWGTAQPVLAKFEGFAAPVPIRAFGNFNVKLIDARLFFSTLFGTRSTYSVSELDDYIQGLIVEILPQALQEVKKMEDLSSAFESISKKIETLLNKRLQAFGLTINGVQTLSALPSKEIIEALEAKSAIQIIGSQKEYLLYKAANSLSESNAGGSNDPMQMMMGLMLGKGLLGEGADSRQKEAVLVSVQAAACANCNNPLVANARFCQACGKKI